MPDLTRRLLNRTNEMQGWWKRVDYINERKAFVKRHPVCIRCGKPTTTPGHSHEDYKDFETYLAAVKTDKCDPLCSMCNLMERSGRRPCPSCLEKHKTDPTVKIHYITIEQETCRYCEPDYDPEKSKIRKDKSARIKKDLGRNQYNRAHPTVKVPVNGNWVSIPRK